MSNEIPLHLVVDFAKSYATVLDISRGTRISSLRSYVGEIEKYEALADRLGVYMFTPSFLQAAREAAIESDSRRRAAYREIFSA